MAARHVRQRRRPQDAGRPGLYRDLHVRCRNLQLAGQNGPGSFETKSVEASTSSLDTDLTKLIVAQQAYAASAKVVTTANDMLQTALGMKQ